MIDLQPLVSTTSSSEKIQLYSKIHRLRDHLLLIPDPHAPESTPFLLFETKQENSKTDQESAPIPEPIQIQQSVFPKFLKSTGKNGISLVETLLYARPKSLYFLEYSADTLNGSDFSLTELRLLDLIKNRAEI